MKKLIMLVLSCFSIASFAALSPLQLTLHQQILDNTQAVINGTASPEGYTGFNTFPWAIIASLCHNSTNCQARIFVLKDNGDRINAGVVTFNAKTGLMSASSKNGYLITINGLAEATIQKIS